MTRINVLVGRNVKRARKQLGLSQAELARHCGISEGFLAEIETARKFPSASTLDRIATCLELRPYQLFLEDEEREVTGCREFEAAVKEVHVLSDDLYQ
jgi:transcriptional regulator with XRE-family HTH domain